MVEPAVATVSICLPSLWSLCIFGYKRFPTEYIRSRWSNGRSSFRIRANKRNSGASLIHPEKAHDYPVSRRNTAEDKEAFADAKETSRSFSPVTPFEEEPSERVRSPAITKSMEIERRVRLYYNHSALSGTPQEPLPQNSWNRDDLERGDSRIGKNPIPVPPKEKYVVRRP